MEYFNRYIDFLLEYQEPNTEKTPQKLKYDEFVAEFNDSFGYNRTKIDDDGYKPDINQALSDFKNFITNNKTKDNKLPTIKTIDILSKGSASWVNTNYPDTEGGTYNYENNKLLASNRGKALADRVIEDIKKYLNTAGYDSSTIEFKKQSTGQINNKKSKLVLNNFIKDNFENNKIDLVNQMASAAGGKTGPAPNTKVKFFKDDSEEIKTRTDYEADKKYYEVLTLENKNADKIYELLSETPAYVTYTARLKSDNKKIRDLYKDNAQTAYVKVIINAEAKKETIVEPEPIPTQESKEFNIKSIPFQKDSSNLASETEYQNLVNILKDPANKVKYVVLIGHAEADDELGKKKFNPKSSVRLTQKSNSKKTYFTENILADLRFILAKERAKKIAKKLYQDLPNWTTKAAKEFKLLALSVGTTFGNELANQKIVQIYIETEDGVKSDSEQQLNLFPNKFKNNKAEQKEIELMRALNYNLGAFYKKYAQKEKMYTTTITPSYAQMATPKNVAQSRIYYNFRKQF